MYKIFRFQFLHILFIVYITEIYFCIVHAGDLKKQEKKPVKETVKQINLIDELHSLYKDAFENEKTYLTRRFFAKDGHTQYTLHVQKLKEVNGVKTHNLRAEGRSRYQKPIIYINNPVEAGMPNPFFSIDEFKKNMFERIQNQKKEFDVKRNHAYKPFTAKHFGNFVSEIFDVKKHVKHEVDSRAKTEFPTKSSNDKLMKESLHKGNNTVNKKRKPKAYLSSANKSTTNPRIKTTTTLSEKTVSHKFVAFDNNNENKTVTETVANKNITNTTTETSIDKNINTKPTADGETTTATVAIEDIITTEPTFDEEETTATLAVENTNTESTAGDELTTPTVAIEDITTEKTVDENITTEMVTDEVSTETKADTTTETTVKTKRTRQARPYVFLGNKYE